MPEHRQYSLTELLARPYTLSLVFLVHNGWNDRAEPAVCILVYCYNANQNLINLLLFPTVFCPYQPSSIVVLLSFMAAYCKSIVLVYAGEFLCVNLKNFASQVQTTPMFLSSNLTLTICYLSSFFFINEEQQNI